MPRKPIRRCGCQPRKSRPLTFSPFARSLAQLSSAYMAKHHEHTSLSDQKAPTDTEVNHLLEDNEFIKQKVEENDELSESSDEELSDDGIVPADFAFFDPKPDDFHGVKTLLQTYLDVKEWDLSSFVDLILGQPTVGTVIKLEDDEDNNLFSVISALNLGRYKDHKCIKELKKFLLKACPEMELMDKLGSLLGEEAQNVGLLVSQRVVNLPLELLTPLYDALFDEISWATEDEPTEVLRKSFRFNYYLLISKIYKHKNVGRRKRPSSDQDEAIIYIKPEDEIFYKLCSWSFSFPLKTQQHGAHELKDYQAMGIVIAVKADQVSKFRKQLKSLLNEP